MKIRITYFVGKMEFSAEASMISEAYDYVKAIIKANELNFPQQEETLSEYMALLVGIKNGNVTRRENHIFRVEGI